MGFTAPSTPLTSSVSGLRVPRLSGRTIQRNKGSRRYLDGSGLTRPHTTERALGILWGPPGSVEHGVGGAGGSRDRTGRSRFENVTTGPNRPNPSFANNFVLCGLTSKRSLQRSDPRTKELVEGGEWGLSLSRSAKIDLTRLNLTLDLRSDLR